MSGYKYSYNWVKSTMNLKMVELAQDTGSGRECSLAKEAETRVGGPYHPTLLFA